jgi:small nuclear ribonucleoprotein (snRNP)-like protein
MAAVPRVLAAALPGKSVRVTLKNGVVVTGRLVELEPETGSVVLDTETSATSSADARPVPHFLCVPRVTLRGSGITAIDFFAAQVNMDLVARAALVA